MDSTCHFPEANSLPLKNDGWNPQDPWDWYIYLHEIHTNQRNVGKNIPYMDPIGEDEISFGDSAYFQG